MTDQPFLPNVPLQDDGGSEESDAPGPLPVVERADGGRFEVQSVTTRFQTGLYVTDRFKDGKNDPPQQVACQEVQFSAKARMLRYEEGWELGWIQTVRPSRFWFVYRHPQGEGAPVKLVISLAEAKRDGNYGEIWYEDPVPLIRDESAEAEMGDDPNIGFWHPDYRSEDHPRLLGWTPQTCGGTKEFWTWLVAYKADGNELVFLHHIHWEVRFGGRLTSAPGIEPDEETGAFLIEEGPGKGGQTPCYDTQEIEPSDDEIQTLEDL